MRWGVRCTFNDGEVAWFKREDVHRVFQSGSTHLIKIKTEELVSFDFSQHVVDATSMLMIIE